MYIKLVISGLQTELQYKFGPKLMYSMKNLVPIISFVAILTACATPQPVLYPNEQAKQAGDEQVRKDIDECTQLAKDSGASSSGASETAKETAGSASEGAATGAATGAVTGNAGTAAAVGAISRGMGRFFRWHATQQRPQPSLQGNR